MAQKPGLWISALSLAITLTGCGDTNSHRTKISKTGPQSKSSSNDRGQANPGQISQKSHELWAQFDKNCANLEVLAQYLKVEWDKEPNTVYLSDSDLGDISPEAAIKKGEVQFVSKTDPAVRANVTMSQSRRPFTMTVGGAGLATSPVGALLAVSQQTNCDAVAFKNGDLFRVLAKTSKSLTIEKQGQIREYKVGDQAVYISVYEPVRAPVKCSDSGLANSYLKSTYVIAFGFLPQIPVTRALAQTLAQTNLAEGIVELQNVKKELATPPAKAAAAPSLPSSTGNAMIPLNPQAYSWLSRQIESGQYQVPTCPGR